MPNWEALWMTLRLHLDHLQVAGVESVHPAVIRDKMDDLENLADKDDQLENMATQTGIHPGEEG
ncbi:unnamed protein product [marine sediment metagenome]|uniref:Uncharacterized protein n=1 Tax=marine sediment metagenome TaxID=412755 RepID=X1VA06_9ZZZZ